MNHLRGFVFAVSFLIVGVLGQIILPEVVESAQVASITAIILASITAYCTVLILDKQGIVTA